MTKTSFAEGQLKSLVERIERLDEERKAIVADIAEVKREAKGFGFNVKIINLVLAIRRKDAEDRAEEEALLDVYLSALGMTPPEREIAETEDDDGSDAEPVLKTETQIPAKEPQEKAEEAGGVPTLVDGPVSNDGSPVSSVNHSETTINALSPALTPVLVAEPHFTHQPLVASTAVDTAGASLPNQAPAVPIQHAAEPVAGGVSATSPSPATVPLSQTASSRTSTGDGGPLTDETGDPGAGSDSGFAGKSSGPADNFDDNPMPAFLKREKPKPEYTAAQLMGAG